jgi:lipopolysaccharide export system protein LptA
MIRVSGAASALVMLGLAAAGPAAAQGFSGHDNEQQIEIVADSLVVEQDQKLAVFQGKVDAVQGTLRLRADTLRVFYGETEQQRAAGGQQQAAGEGAEGQDAGGQGAEGQQIRRIEAYGKVFLTAPGESAQGDRGVYQVPEGLVTLEGDVVLTRADNVVRGARLDTNLRTGISKVTAAAPGGRPEQRVRSLFVPERREEAPGGGSATRQAPPTPAPRGGS